jgi:hypothetical protein
MRSSLVLVLLLAGTAALNFGQVHAPRAGVARYADGTVRVIHGIDGNYIANDKGGVTAQRVAFSDAGGLVATGGRLKLLNADLEILEEVALDEESPLLNIDSDLNSAVAWLPHQHRLICWNGVGFSQTEVSDPINGTATWVSLPDAKHAELLTADQSGNAFSTTISLASGNIVAVQVLSSVVGSAYRLGSAVVSHIPDGLRIYLPDGTSVNIRLAVDDLIVERMAPNSLHLSSASGRGDWVLHLDKKGAHFWELPGRPGK